jgi:exodeoxyribonuclease VII small subunit
MIKNKPKSNPLEVAEMTFEESLAELEGIVTAAELDDAPLATTMQQFERGIALAAHCKTLLETAERKVSMLLPDGDVADFE